MKLNEVQKKEFDSEIKKFNNLSNMLEQSRVTIIKMATAATGKTGFIGVELVGENKDEIKLHYPPVKGKEKIIKATKKK